MTGWQWRGGGAGGSGYPIKWWRNLYERPLTNLFNLTKWYNRWNIKDLPCIWFIRTAYHYCFVCLFGALVFLSRILAIFYVFFVCWLKFPSDLAMISLSSVMNIWVWLALSLRGARPLPGTLKVCLEGYRVYGICLVPTPTIYARYTMNHQ